jgi:glycosyltransferase involved in cell wall biosynthesis
MDDLTAVILTYNEQENIERTLDAITWIQRVIVVDSFSSDDTLKIAKSYPNVTVVQRQFDDHTTQWNFGLDQAGTEWVLSLDADYEVSSQLREEIARLAPENDVAGYAASFEYRIFGRSLRASAYPPRVVLFRKQRGRYVADGHTQLLRVDGEVRELISPVFHDDRKPFSRWLRSQDKYSKLEAEHLLEISKAESGKRKAELSVQDKLRLKIFFAPPAMFFYLLFGRGLILDGWRGWYYVAQRLIAESLLSIRLLELKRSK